jgi:hypothetical protein
VYFVLISMMAAWPHVVTYTYLHSRRSSVRSLNL